jgi:hypothetical protein
MKGMIHKALSTQGGSVKKTVFIVALAAVLVLAFGGTAFAVGINHSGQLRIGAEVAFPPGEPAQVNGVTTAGAGTNTYADWDTTLGSNSTNGNSPHGNYTTTTVKCVVCHAIHYAAPSGAPVGSGQAADTLLRMKASDACIYCHATAGVAVNGTPVYDGLGGAILAPGASGGNTLTGHITGQNCSYCHTTVHGSGADNSVAALNGFLLKTMTATNVQGTGATTTDMIGAITAIDHNAVNQGFLPAGSALGGTIGAFATTPFATDPTLRMKAVGVFCAECHLGAYSTVAAGASTNVYGSGTAAFTGHRMAAAATTTWNLDGSKSSSVTNGTIAWADATDCTSCHDATDAFGIGFPHSWAGAKMWLTSSPAFGTPTTKLTKTAGGTDNGLQLSDGVCLKCHVASGGSAGVGISY